MAKIIDVSELASVKDIDTANEVAASRKAIMDDPRLTNIVLGAFNSPRRIECRFDEATRTIYPCFEV